MKKISFGIVGLILIALVAVLASYGWWTINTKPVSDDTSKARVVIPKGRSAEAIGIDLEEKNVIRSAFAFKVYVQFFDKQTAINAGEFLLSPSMNLAEAVETLRQSPIELWVTIPEGLRREEIAERVATGIELTGEQKQLFITDFLKESDQKEGYLFPDTYLLSRDVTPNQIIVLMESNFNTRFDSTFRAKMEAKGLTLSEAVSLASILEKETKTDTERLIVAGIYFNRLEIGQPLQTDASVQYVLGTKKCEGVIEGCKWWQPPLRGDLVIDSIYNTYKYPGIPPYPISNPGLSSLRSIVESKDNPYFYYIHEPDGTVHYGVTLDEHNANVQKYLR